MKTHTKRDQIEPRINGFTSQLFILQGTLMALLSFPGLVNVITMTKPVKGFTELWASLLWTTFMLVRYQPEVEKQTANRVKPTWRVNAGLLLAFVGIFALVMWGESNEFLGALVGALVTYRFFTQDGTQLSKVAASMAASITVLSIVVGLTADVVLLREWTYLALSIPFFMIAVVLGLRTESRPRMVNRATR